MLARSLRAWLPSGQRVAARLQEDLRELAAMLRAGEEGWEPWVWDGQQIGEEALPWQAEQVRGEALIIYTQDSAEVCDDDAAVV